MGYPSCGKHYPASRISGPVACKAAGIPSHPRGVDAAGG